MASCLSAGRHTLRRTPPIGFAFPAAHTGETLFKCAATPMNLSDLRNVFKDSIAAWIADYAPSMGAALAYYTIFSIAPLLVIVIAVAGLVFGADAATGAIFEQLRGMVGDSGANAIQGLVRSASKPATSALAAMVGLVTLVLGATTVLGELQSSLDRIWRAPPEEPRGLWRFFRARVLSFGMILAIGFLLLVSLVLSAAIVAVGSFWGGWFASFRWLLEALNSAISFLIVAALFATIYKVLPRVVIGWRDVTVGAAVTALLFTVGKFLIGLYLGTSGVTSGFGAAGSLVVLLVWVYYSAQIFLLGAEFTSVYAYRFGSLRASARPPPSGIRESRLRNGERIGPAGASQVLPSASPSGEKTC